jgi:hypothetical protein
MALTVEAWCLVLEEVRRQAARNLQSAGIQAPETDGVWYDVAEGMNRSTELDSVDENGAWQQLQWLNAFQVLVSEHNHHCGGLPATPCQTFPVLSKYGDNIHSRG